MTDLAEATLQKIYDKWLVGDGGTNTYLDYPAFVCAAEEVAAAERERCAATVHTLAKENKFMAGEDRNYINGFVDCGLKARRLILGQGK